MNNKDQYRNICRDRGDVPLFLQDWWLDAVCENWDAAIAQNGDTVSGIWPYDLQQRMGVKLLRTPKLTPYAGPHVFFPADLKPVNRDGFEYESIAAMMKQLPEAKVWHLSMQPGLKQAGLFKNAGLNATVQQTFLIDLQQSEAQLFSNLKESLRRNIKAAKKEFTIVNDPAAIHTLFKYQQHTLERKDVLQAYSLTDIERLHRECNTHNCSALWVAKKEDDIAAILWNVWDAGRSYYFMGAQKPNGDTYRAMPALLWHSILEAKKRGNQYFDMEGSMDVGVEKFFRNFGGNRELYLVLKKNKSLVWKLKELIR
ncbi:MAG: GNAT family N-acetyltransferase [Bacteroidetes bacterium]|nr:GNAT family N-acetyltransferase [Bacteroidota bacterium]